MTGDNSIRYLIKRLRIRAKVIPEHAEGMVEHQCPEKKEEEENTLYP